MCKYAPSLLSVSCLYLVAKILGNKGICATMLLKEFEIEEEAFKTCLRDVFEVYKSK